MSHEQFTSSQPDLYEESRRRSDIDLLISGGVVHEGLGINVSPEITARLTREHELGSVVMSRLIDNEPELLANVPEEQTPGGRILVPHDPELARIATTSIEEYSNQEVRFDEIKYQLSAITQPYNTLFDELKKLPAPEKKEYIYGRARSKHKNMLWYNSEVQNPTYSRLSSEVIRNGQVINLLNEAFMDQNEGSDKLIDEVRISGTASDGSVPELHLKYDKGTIASIRYKLEDIVDTSRGYDDEDAAAMTPLSLLRGIGRTKDVIKDGQSTITLRSKRTNFVMNELAPKLEGELTIELGDNPRLIIDRVDYMPYIDKNGLSYEIAQKKYEYRQIYYYSKDTGEFVAANDAEDDIPSRLKQRLSAAEVATILSNTLGTIPSTDLSSITG